MVPILSFAQGQKKFSVEGSVTLYGTSEPIPYANVVIKELNLWGITNSEGKFKINGVLSGSYTFEVSSLGYQKIAVLTKISGDLKDYKLQLKEENLTLEDVVVTAKAGSSLNSSSKIDKSAIEHLQATSLADVMQLMPGTLIKNPTLTSANVITIRSISDNAFNALGVGVLVNGSKVSSDATLYSQDPYDFRKISTDNIENVEVLKGVVSAEYGDMTSGAILVTTKTGKTPLAIRVKTDPRTKAVSLSKGLALGGRSGNINFDVDYARSFVSWVSPVTTYDRVTMGITYSNTFNKENTPFKFNARISGYTIANNVTADPDVSSLDFIKRKDNNLSLAIYGNWQLNKDLITSLTYNFSGTWGNERYQNFVVTTANPLPTTNTMVPGVALGYFTNTLDQRDQHVEEVPVYGNAKISANKIASSGTSIFKTSLGIEFNTRGNLGRGEYYANSAPQWFRERNYSDIPFMSDLSLFLEEKITSNFDNGTAIDFSAGVRANKMIIKGYSYDPTIEPRLNAKYSLFKNSTSSLFKDLSFRGGWGVMQKLPSIGYLYPAPNYIDAAVFQYRNTITGQQMALIQTTIIDELLPYNLKPQTTNKFEIGLDFKIKNVEGAITFFNESLRDGITGNTNYLTEDFKYYTSTTDPNAAPKFENGKIWIKDSEGNYVEQTSTTTKEFKGYSRPDNRGKLDTWGIEYDFNLGKIKPLNTSILLSGGYLRNIDSSPGYIYSYSSSADPLVPSQKYPYVGIYEGSTTMSIGSGRDRLSTNLNLVTNIPSIRLVVSFTTQIIWMTRSWNLYDEGNVYKLDGSGNPVYGDYNGKYNNYILYRDPVSYLDMQGNYRSFQDYYTTTDSALKLRLGMLRKSTDVSYYFLKTSYYPYMMANIRITKELGDLASFSFYANNFTNSTPIMRNNARPEAPGMRVNLPIYFGAELKLTF